MSITEAVQRALVSTMRADPALQALVDTRVFDDVPVSADHPYVSLGPEDWRPIDDDCLSGDDGFVQIDVWSRAPGRVECKRITDRIARLFQGALLELEAPYVAVSVRVVLKRVLGDPDAGTRHGVLQLEVLTEEDLT